MSDHEPRSGKILVFVVAYSAQNLIAATLDRIPKDLFDSPDLHFLCIDDASSDQTAQVAADWVHQHGYRNVTVLRNPVNQRYGGNQKLGYRLAIEWGFDFVILLHGDGQYAPELLPEFIRIWNRTASDVILGSRMQSLAEARKGGMPIYKLIGNRILTFFQNRLSGQHLSEWHTGYRGYSAALLRKIPFEINTSDFHFDTQILFQAIYVGARFTEFAIPTRYGEEICHVNGLNYARNVLLETFRFRMHRSGMLCSLKYRDLCLADTQAGGHLDDTSRRRVIEELDRLKPRTILHIGGGNTPIITVAEKLGAHITTAPAQAKIEAIPSLVDVFDYDCILMLDVMERLAEPERFLLDLRNQSRRPMAQAAPARFILTTPNVAFFLVRMNLLLGRFTYAPRGILEISHKRLFTKTSLRTALRDCGYCIEKIIPIPPAGSAIGGTIGKILGAISALLAKIWPRMFAFQWLVVCRPRPGVHHLLAAVQQNIPGPFAITSESQSATEMHA